MNWTSILLVGSGGFFGSIARYVTARSIDEKFQATIPYGTLTVNIVGSLIIGVVYGLSLRVNGFSENWRLLLGAGFCGGFTTFSAFALENVNLINQKMQSASAIYMLASLVLGGVAVVAGIAIGRLL